MGSVIGAENPREENQRRKTKKKKMLEIKKTLMETNNAFDVLIRRLDMARERISALEDID